MMIGPWPSLVFIESRAVRSALIGPEVPAFPNSSTQYPWINRRNLISAKTPRTVRREAGKRRQRTRESWRTGR